MSITYFPSSLQTVNHPDRDRSPLNLCANDMESRVRLPCHFQSYRENGYLIDCIIKCCDKEFPAHRLVLARYSDFFRQLFLSTTSQDVYQFTPDFNPQNCLISVVDFLYTGRIKIDASNVVAILATADHYKISVLKDIAHFRYCELLETLPSVNTALTFARHCADYGYSEQHNEVVPVIAQNFNSFTHDQLFESLNAAYLSEVLRSDKMPDLTADERLSLIDDFDSVTPVLDETDKAKLARVIDWSSNDAYMYLARHKCAWMPSRIVRPLYKRVIMARRQTATALRQRAEAGPDTTSRWFPFTWLAEVKNASGRVASVSQDLVKFATTLGTNLTTVKGDLMGVIHVKSSGTTETFPVQNVFDGKRDTYFQGIWSRGEEAPFVSLGFGPLAYFTVEKVRLVCRTPEFIEKKNAKVCELKQGWAENVETRCPVPKKIAFVGRNGQKVTKRVRQFTERAIDVNIDSPISDLRVSLDVQEEAEFGVAVLRIFAIEVYGEFVPLSG